MTRTDTTLRRDIEAAPPGSIYWRNMGSGKVEVITVVRGHVTRLGVTKDEKIIALAESVSKQAGTK